MQFLKVFGNFNAMIMLINTPALKPWVCQNVSQRKIFAQNIGANYFLFEQAECILYVLFHLVLLFFSFLLVPHCRVKSSYDFSSILLNKSSHFNPLKCVLWNKLSSSIKGFCDIPTNEVTLSQNNVAVDKNGDFSIRFWIMCICIQVSLCKKSFFISQANTLIYKLNLFLQKGQPCSLSKGAYFITQQFDLTH